MISVIPDVHADAERLSATLARIDLGSRIAFLGDLIDAGSKVRMPADRQVLMSARGLIEDGRAVAIMGNHELNAILFHRLGPGGPLREHSDKNLRQHRSFVDAFGKGTAAAKEWTDWFLYALPLNPVLEVRGGGGPSVPVRITGVMASWQSFRTGVRSIGIESA